MIKSIEWLGNSIRFLDQTKLPIEEVYIETDDLFVLTDAILTLKLRGAPLLGISAAYGIVLGVQPLINSSSKDFFLAFENSFSKIANTRPTAKNLFWALERMRHVLRLNEGNSNTMLFEKLLQEAKNIHEEDAAMCAAIGKFGAELIPHNAKIITHCNTGALATGGIGTAQAVLVTAHKMGKNICIFADETRPLLQGARLTVWELMREGINVNLQTDNTAAWTIKTKNIGLIITGADRIASNGDTANKIGTYNLAVLAKEHGIPFYIAAPTSTIDFSIQSGDEIIIEERGSEEVIHSFGKQIAPIGTKVFSPAFDITPHKYISAIITEKGILSAPFNVSIRSVMQ